MSTKKPATAIERLTAFGGNDSIRKIIGIDAKDKYAPFIKFFDAKGNYKLSPYLDEAYKAAVPDQFQKDFIEADRKVNLLNSALSGSILKIFPIPKRGSRRRTTSG